MGCLCFSWPRAPYARSSARPLGSQSISSSDHRDEYRETALSRHISASNHEIPGSSDTGHHDRQTQSLLPPRKGLILLSSSTSNIEPQADYDLDVVAIHGLTGHPFETWTYNEHGRNVLWLQDLLPNALPGANIYTYGYDADLFFSSSIVDIDSCAKALLDRLLQVREPPASAIAGSFAITFKAKYLPSNTLAGFSNTLAGISDTSWWRLVRNHDLMFSGGAWDIKNADWLQLCSRPIVFICHSMGGLVCKKALIIANEQRDRFQSILDSTKAIFFFGTPHHGSLLANIAYCLSPLYKVLAASTARPGLIKNLRAKSSTLKDLSSAFTERAKKIPCIISFYETNKSYGQIIVSAKSATIGGSEENIVPLEGNHSQICRISDENQTAFLRIVEECQKIGIDMSGASRILSVKEHDCLESLNALKSKPCPDAGTFPAKGTCEWVRSAQQYNTWRDGLPPLLLITGEFGCGKTTLISYLRYHLLDPNAAVAESTDKKETPFKVRKRSTTCGFFGDAGNSEIASGVALLKGLLSSIFHQRHDLIHHLLEVWQPFRPWMYKDLWRIFQTILDDPRSSGVCVIIDALDECDPTARVDFLEDLSLYLNQRSKSGRMQATFVVSSRLTTVENMEELQPLTSYLKLDRDALIQGHMAADIRHYVLHELQALLIDGQLYPKSYRDGSAKVESLADTIAIKSEGSFLWASLIVGEVKGRSFVRPRDVDDFISECPPGLHSFYYKALAKVNSGMREDILKSLHIILAAKKPLTVAEFKVALAIQRHHQTLGDVQRTSEQDLLPILSLLERNLSILIKIDGSTITFRHQAVRSFLLNDLAGPRHSKMQRQAAEHDPEVCDAFSISMQEAESSLAVSCIYYLKLGVFDRKKRAQEVSMAPWNQSGLGVLSTLPTEKSPTLSDPVGREHLDETPEPWDLFFDYAACNWGRHYASAESSDEALNDAALELSNRPNIYDNWSHQFRLSHWGYDNLPECPNALIVAAYFGQTSMARKLVSNDGYQSSRPLALTWAARMGHIEVIKLLVELGTSPKAALLDGRAAFSWAVAGGFLDIVDMSLTNDEGLINVQDDNGCSPLVLATQYQHLDILDRLLATPKTNIDLRNDQGAVAFNLAICGSNPTVREMAIFHKLLRDPRADITLRDNKGRSCLSYLAEYDATEAIQALLDCDNRTDAVLKILDDEGDNNGDSPLTHAACKGHVRTARLLCQANKVDAQLHSVDKTDGANIFHLAARFGQVDIIRLLKEYYSQGLNSRDATGRTPLSTAVEHTSESVLRALLDCGADVNLPDFEGRTPVSHGVGNVEFVKVLVGEYGADINEPDDAEKTPLWYARDLDKGVQQELRELGARL